MVGLRISSIKLEVNYEKTNLGMVVRLTRVKANK